MNFTKKARRSLGKNLAWTKVKKRSPAFFPILILGYHLVKRLLRRSCIPAKRNQKRTKKNSSSNPAFSSLLRIRRSPKRSRRKYQNSALKQRYVFSILNGAAKRRMLTSMYF